MGERPWQLDYGARRYPDGTAQFRVWAPKVRALAVQIVDGPLLPLSPEAPGSFSGLVTLPRAPAVDYFYVLDGQHRRPDPVSRWQPQGVHGSSRLVDPQGFSWSDRQWTGIPLEHYLLYELHLGTFTAEGSCVAAIDRLPYLRQLGITAIELMPVAQFPGDRSWGYDGVYPYAPQASYGGPLGLKQLIDAAHRAGLAVVLDVVYNHLGPEGNYLRDFGPYFSDRYRTPWGEALNFDGPDSDGVRRYVIDNALYWLTEFHVDALRLDAIHQIYDFSARPVLQELQAAFHAQAQLLGHKAFLIAESDLNDPRILRPVAAGGYGLDAQWNDDFHHSLHALLSGSQSGYFADFGSLEALKKAITQGFVYTGQYSAFRRRRHGRSAADRPGHQLVVYSQNHDQVANASHGARHSALLPIAQQKLAAVLLLTVPYLPMLFMGQEFSTAAPFFYFTSFTDPDLAAAVKLGRRLEYQPLLQGGDFPDPQAVATFAKSKLRWEELAQAPHREVFQLYRALFALRRENLVLASCRSDQTHVQVSDSDGWMVIQRSAGRLGSAIIAANFSPATRRIPGAAAQLAGGDCLRLALHSWDRELGGDGSAAAPPHVWVPAASELTLPAWAAVIYLQSGSGSESLAGPGSQFVAIEATVSKP